MRKIRFGVAAVALLLVAVPAADAHVTVQPTEATTGSFARFAVRVPNERDNAATVKVEVQLPESLTSVGFQPLPGWMRTVERKPRRAPIDEHGEQITDYVASVTWESGRIEPGEFQEFGFSARMPEEAATLTFPAVQTYEGGEVVRWIGPADADSPAARVTLSAAAEKEGEDDDEDEAEVPAVVPWAALGVATVALVLGLAGMRRRP